jgi:hypothetical protein
MNFMKLLLTSLVFILSIHITHSQQTAFTASGRKVILFSNGTWVSADSVPAVSQALNSPRNLREEFNNTYKFAYDELFSDVFLDNDRKSKAANWAFNSFSSQLYFFSGNKSLTSWYEDLYYIVYNYFFHTIFFDAERQSKTNDWLKTWMDKRTVFDPAYYATYLARFREAFSIAYNNIYQNEFGDPARRSKSMAWATSLLKDK